MNDLSSLNTVAACDKGADIELRHPVTNAPLGMFITVLGKDSTKFKEISRASLNARLRRDALATRRGKEPEIRTVEDIEKENIDLLVACTTGWSLTEKGIELVFSPAEAARVYKQYPFIYDQVNEGIGSLENFLAK